jgi:hypothetical protein
MEERIFDEIPADLFDRIVAVDAGSGPGAVELLKKKGIEVVQLEGKDALEMVAKGKLEVNQDSIVFFAADGRNNPRDIGKLLLALERGQDMVIASRFLHGGARHDRNSRFRYRSTGNRVLTLLANLFYYGNFSDTLHTFRAVKRQRLEELKLNRAGLSGFYQLSIRAMKNGWKVGEVPTVELVSADLNDRKKVILSILPLSRVLLSELFGAGKEKREVK